MRRTERLFQLIQILRSSRSPMTGRALAEELEVSIRTLYRDMAELVAQRVPVRGEAGTGYILEEGYDLPPLMLTADELDVVVLGAAWVARRGDATLARGARDLVAKLLAVVPPALRPILLDGSLQPFGTRTVQAQGISLDPLRTALRERRKVAITYADPNGAVTTRVIWPIYLAYLEEVRIIVAWCEMRQDFRHFRADRVQTLTLSDDRLPERLEVLRRRWKQQDRQRPAETRSQTVGPDPSCPV